MERRALQQEVAANAAPTPTKARRRLARNVGGYNAFWLDRGMKVGVVHGKARSSWITEPAEWKDAGVG